MNGRAFHPFAVSRCPFLQIAFAEHVVGAHRREVIT